MTLLRSIVPGFGRRTPATPSSTAPTLEARIKPVFHVREDEHGYDVSVDLPGVAKAGLEITSLAGQGGAGGMVRALPGDAPGKFRIKPEPWE